MDRSFMVRLAGTLAVAGILLAACGGDDDAEGAAQQPTSTEAPATTAPLPGSEEAETTEGVATLAAASGSGVSGAATLRWGPDTRVLDVTVELIGLDEGATYAVMITPSCGPGSGHLYTVGNAVGAPDGMATLTAEIADVDSIDVDGGWAIKVALPPAGPQACGEVTSA